ncbi:PTS system, mannose-specific IIA component [Albimonas donghaensis]|uniref:PTS system, mannose-specific IIA component n=1 Tax=Albimonas donghaensis TaxID=356660 RepID=A0A1H3E073_9RHOB|nr:PTS fructose transporter subunit IIA [Albimonas donghaensis]SDX72091.1 PTS system, mannose-specific IIA component [Albimonas donghaensis]
MIGIVIVAHGALAPELLAATEHVVGPLQAARAIAIHPHDDLRARQEEVAAAAEEVDGGQGVVLITDMFGGSPSNLAMGALSRPMVEVIYGANLPLLVKLAKSRTLPLEEAVSLSLAAGRKYLDSAGGILAARRRAKA